MIPPTASPGAAQRREWIATLEKTALPLFGALAAGELKRRMPVEQMPGKGREECSHLEGVGRSLLGIAPWLECAALRGEEEERRAALAALVREGLGQATDPASPDFLNFARGSQPLVDGAFLAQGLLRCRTRVWETLEPRVRRAVVDALKATRAITPGYNNWLLFSAMVEAFLAAVGEEWDGMRVDYAIRQHEQWYVGDGAYGDGPFFHWDYYNSFVIQPMLLDTLRALAGVTPRWEAFLEPVSRRARRYAAVLERLIAPDGTFPVIGRSMAYRCGAFHALAQAAALETLPPELDPAQVRCALGAVIRRSLGAEGTFDAGGWLRIGVCGSQPAMGESYLSTGSLYLCLCAFLPLGLGPEHPFWSAPDAPWTSKKVWAGEPVEADHALYDIPDYALRLR
jgi:hypothetical protein